MKWTNIKPQSSILVAKKMGGGIKENESLKVRSLIFGSRKEKEKPDTYMFSGVWNKGKSNIQPFVLHCLSNQTGKREKNESYFSLHST